MLLRRITQHVKTQNWFAVTLDFIIVVIGVAVAMMGQQWLSELAQKNNFVEAQKAVENDLFRNYLNANERMAVAPCRIQAYQSISKKLLEPGDEWTGMPRAKVEKDLFAGNTALPNLLRSPSRIWGANTWTAELNRGTFNSMDVERRNTIDALLESTDHAQKLQREIYSLQGQMKTLALSTRISQAERLRYLDNLGELDVKSGLLELIAGQIVRSIGSLDLDITQEFVAQIYEFLPGTNASLKSVYGECVVPITMKNLIKQVKPVEQP